MTKELGLENVLNECTTHKIPMPKVKKVSVDEERLSCVGPRGFCACHEKVRGALLNVLVA